jgi:hypothetical protein
LISPGCLLHSVRIQGGFLVIKEAKWEEDYYQSVLHKKTLEIPKTYKTIIVCKANENL